MAEFIGKQIHLKKDTSYDLSEYIPENVLACKKKYFQQEVATVLADIREETSDDEMMLQEIASFLETFEILHFSKLFHVKSLWTSSLSRKGVALFISSSGVYLFFESDRKLIILKYWQITKVEINK